MKVVTDPVVLVVDDNRNLADMYAAWLSDSYTVRTAYGGEDALTQLDSSVDIVLLDRRMPDLAGERVLQAIRERNVDCQVALVTSVEMDYDSLPLGFDDYLQKPVTESALRTLVESLAIRIEYSDKLQEYFALVSKRVALQTEKETDESAAHPAVQELDAQIADLQEEVDGYLATLSDAEYQALFHRFASHEDFKATNLGLG